MVGALAQRQERGSVASGAGVGLGERLFRQQSAYRLRQRQADHRPHLGRTRRRQPDIGEGRRHRLDDGVLAVDEGPVAIEQDQRN